ncbi:MAG TPA: SAM-dependent chlorinase/fluorinase [Bacteroidales bacterium]|nr:SAM-dependent chlorinase/fluorinase [Bacteroidales bacterium]
MQLVTLTTDWGRSDHYVGAVKAKLYSTINDCQVIDISHDIKKFDLMEGAFIVRNACLNFPKNTIHIIDVDCSESKKKKHQHAVIKYNDQFFICTDNGMPSIIFEGLSPIKVIGITESYQESSYYTFSAFDLFCKVAALISYETNIEELGYEITELVKKNVLTPIIYPDSILCTVFHVDGYGNVFLNITIGEFMKWKENKKFVIEVESNKIVSISHSYDDVKVNDPLLTISSSGYLELAINRSNASELLGLKVGTPLAITIDPKESQK